MRPKQWTLQFLKASAVFLTCVIFVLGRRKTILPSSDLRETRLNASAQLNIFDFDKLSEFKPPFQCKELPPYLLNTSFVICHKYPGLDQFISSYIYKYVRYEKELVNDFLSALNNYPDAYVLDLGSNIGVFTLAAAVRGHHVVSVDPIVENHGLLYNSLVLSNKDNLVIQLINCVSDEHTMYLAYTEDPNNPGDTVMLNINDPEFKQINKENLPPLTSVLLRDLLDLVPEGTPAVLKLDVQGYECKALKELTERGQMQRFIPYIVMETSEICEIDNQLCPEYRHTFLPGLERAGYIPHIPHPISYKDLEKSCLHNVFFVHKSAKPVPQLNLPHLGRDYHMLWEILNPRSHLIKYLKNKL